jgi:hypothetical protein
MPIQTTILCPRCKTEISLDDALTHQIEERFKKIYGTQLEKDKAEFIKQAEAKATQRIKDQLEQEMKNTADALTEAKERNKQLLIQLTETNKLIRDLKRKDEERSFEMEKKLAESEGKIRVATQKKAEEEQHLKLLEKDKQLSDIKKQLEEAQRKAQQGSQQNQGEVLELELEQILTREFLNDKISPVNKGVRGADLIQEVWDRTGIHCGTILWESKNAKWNENWIEKLKDDQRQIKAELAILLSENVPPSIKGAAYRDGVWVLQRTFAIGIGMALRANLIQASYIKRSFHGKDEKKEVLWNYLTSTSFTQRMEVIIDTFIRMQENLDQERRAYPPDNRAGECL